MNKIKYLFLEITTSPSRSTPEIYMIPNLKEISRTMLTTRDDRPT